MFEAVELENYVEKFITTEFFAALGTSMVKQHRRIVHLG